MKELLEIFDVLNLRTFRAKKYYGRRIKETNHIYLKMNFNDIPYKKDLILSSDDIYSIENIECFKENDVQYVKLYVEFYARRVKEDE